LSAFSAARRQRHLSLLPKHLRNALGEGPHDEERGEDDDDVEGHLDRECDECDDVNRHDNFKGAPGPVLTALQGVELSRSDAVIDDATASEPSTGHGGAIAVAIVSEYAVPARSAERKIDTTTDGSGVRGETDGGQSPIAHIQRRISEIVVKLREPERPP